MKKLPLFLLALTGCLVSHAQVNISMYSGMNGTLVLEDGSTTNFWGYGLTGTVMSLPAPLLEFNTGDMVDIEFTNLSQEAHTIHLHGLDVDQVNDGVPQTSFYVFGGETVNYAFTNHYPGTYLYHCHVTTTLHLTMGMYGMIVVHEPGNVLYAGGPGYDREYEYLVSDLEIAVNDAPIQAFPFHEIRPDYFMVNGKSGTMITDNTNLHTLFEPGESVALRVGSMAYTLTEWHFPEGSNPEVFMSDGRPLPASFESPVLEVYPGERFSIILQPEAGLDELIEVKYYSMVNKEYQGSNFVPIRDLSTLVDENTDEFILPYPNPASEFIRLELKSQELIRVFDPAGRIVYSSTLQAGLQTIDLQGFASGTYLLIGDGGTRATFAVK